MEKIICKYSHKALDGIVKKGDVCEMETIRYEEDTVLHNGNTRKDEETGEVIVVNAPIIAEKGSAKDIRIILPDGRKYTASMLHGFTGWSIVNIFDKIDSHE